MADPLINLCYTCIPKGADRKPNMQLVNPEECQSPTHKKV